MKNIRTRFAPSPTGIMHIGNVRAALLNYLFARQNNGIFLLRIEDTDLQRNITDGTQFIIKHLQWLGLNFQEGPEIGGPHAPYFQSQRSFIYKKYLDILYQKNAIYRCFCTPEELDIRRNRQIALKKPPRYEGTCLKLCEKTISEKLSSKKTFIWRMKIDSSKKIVFTDLARGPLEFDLQHFSDFPLTREDGSFTFIFANCIDDCEMKISHVFRGEEHLSNTVSQMVLYQALDHPFPIFWHLPILCNQEGKKLSKRDKGFSLEDIEQQGYLPEAICNYLAILGCSFEEEILSLEQLVKLYQFDRLHGASQIRYDIEKLKWINHKWINLYNIEKLTLLCKPFLQPKYDLSKLSDTTLQLLINVIKSDMYTLYDAIAMTQFYFEKPAITKDLLKTTIKEEKITDLLLLLHSSHKSSWLDFSAHIAKQAKMKNIENKELYSSIRLLITGSPTGLQIKDLFETLGSTEFFNRLHIIH
ncbi:glutamate--tRNA ligase [Candidatus Dependentiae bacterium]|nr:glutamate--tRNA ligase [Candidatus Dependentiae bacterium]